MRFLRFLIIASIFHSLTAGAYTAGQKYGIGILLGNPTGLSGQYKWSPKGDLNFGFSYSSGEHVSLSGDYVLNYPGFFKNNSLFNNRITPSIGVGLLVAASQKSRSSNSLYYGKSSGALGAALRVPFLLEWRSDDPTIGIFLEVVPGISLTPETGGYLQGGVGIRYYF